MAISVSGGHWSGDPSVQRHTMGMSECFLEDHLSLDGVSRFPEGVMVPFLSFRSGLPVIYGELFSVYCSLLVELDYVWCRPRVGRCVDCVDVSNLTLCICS